MKRKNGFTLIELLAVIIILGILMIIAIPSVTSYINNSRKSAYVDTAKQIISGARNMVNEGKLEMYSTDTTYYIPSSCIKTENGGEAESPYGKFKQAYIGVIYDGKGYDYFWISTDDAGEGVENVTILTKNKIQTIRNTKNTSLTGRDTNNIYYVSNSGNDDNDGKTPETAWKTIKKVQTVLNVNGGIPDGSTILFNRGDIFRGQFTTYKSDILLGAYGDESKDKPKIYASPYDGTKTGEWVEVKNNIWKYTIDGDDQIFKKDVGQIWFFCNHSNSTCNRTTTMGDIHYAMAQKKMTYFNVEENEDMLVELLTHDLDFYHMGHNSNNGSGDFKKDGGAIYACSTPSPAAASWGKPR